MIKVLRFHKNWRGFQEGSRIFFRPGVNLIVGDQGCGKSTILSQIMAFNASMAPKGSRQKKSWGESAVEVSGTPSPIGHFDFEKDNPRTQPAFGMSLGYDDGYQLSAMYASHGEAVKPFLGMIEHVKGKVLLLDEPDMALSVRSITNLVKSLKSVTDEGQVILSVHNETLISSFPEVMSLEHGKWMSSEDW